jgi:hypothetical protein
MKERDNTREGKGRKTGGHGRAAKGHATIYTARVAELVIQYSITQRWRISYVRVRSREGTSSGRGVVIQRYRADVLAGGRVRALKCASRPPRESS